MNPLKIGVLLSGSGTNLQAIISAIEGGLPVSIVRVISSRPDAFGIQRAEAAGIPVTALSRASYEDPEAADALIARQMQEAGAEYVVMAGYMRKLTPVVLDAFPDRVLNLHPALLPSFKGAHAIEQALAYGVKVFGVTVHWVDATLDGGRIIAQRAFSYEGSDLAELERQVHATEHPLYVETVKRLLNE